MYICNNIICQEFAQWIIGSLDKIYHIDHIQINVKRSNGVIETNWETRFIRLHTLEIECGNNIGLIKILSVTDIHEFNPGFMVDLSKLPVNIKQNVSKLAEQQKIIDFFIL